MSNCFCHRPDRNCEKCREESIKRGYFGDDNPMTYKQKMNDNLKKLLDDIESDPALLYVIKSDKELMKRLRKVMKKD